MGTLTEQEQWPEGVRYFEENAILTGGPDAPDNLPLQDLADRTAWLKARLAELLANTSAHASAADPHPVYLTEAEGNALIAAAVSSLVNSSPATLDTLSELAAALGNDANFATTITNALAQKAPLASPTLTGIPTAPTAPAGTSNQQVATTKFVTDVMANAGTVATESVAGKVELATTTETIAGTDNQRAVHPAALAALLTLFARLDSPALTGTPTSSTPATGDNSTKIATTAYVKAQLDSPALTGVPTAPTAGTGTTSNQVATTAFVHAVVAALVNAAPAALDTLSELSAALGNDANFATTVTNALSTKSDAGHTHTAEQVSGLSAVAASGSYNDLLDKPSCIKQTLSVIDTGAIVLAPEISIYHLEVTGATSISIDVSALADHTVITFEFQIVMATVQTVTFPENVVWLDSATPDLSLTGTYLFAFRSYDNGTTWKANLQGKL